jgi:hypothetical protein
MEIVNLPKSLAAQPVNPSQQQAIETLNTRIKNSFTDIKIKKLFMEENELFWSRIKRIIFRAKKMRSTERKSCFSTFGSIFFPTGSKTEEKLLRARGRRGSLPLAVRARANAMRTDHRRLRRRGGNTSKPFRPRIFWRTSVFVIIFLNYLIQTKKHYEF